MAAVFTMNVTYLANSKVEELASFRNLYEAEVFLSQLKAREEFADVLVGGNSFEFETFSERYFVGRRSRKSQCSKALPFVRSSMLYKRPEHMLKRAKENAKYYQR